MKKHCFLAIFAALLFCTLNLQAQTPCSQRLIRHIDFAYTGGGAIPQRWDINQTSVSELDFIINPNFTYAATGNMANTTDRKYAITQNPSTLDPSYANITVTPGGILVMDPLRNSNNDEFGVFQIYGLIPENVYWIEIKVHNLYKAATTPACCWNDLLSAEVRGNGNNPHDGQPNHGPDEGVPTGWTGTNISNGTNGANGNWDMNTNYPQGMLRPGANGSYAIMRGRKHLGNATNGFTITFRKGNSAEANQMVLGIEYIKIYGCEAEAIITSTGSNKVCENTTVTLTARGLAPMDGIITWRENNATGNIIQQSTSRDLTITAPSVGTNVTYYASGAWSNKTITIEPKVCCSSAGGQQTEIFRESFSNVTFTTHNGLNRANIPGLGVYSSIGTAYTYNDANRPCSNPGTTCERYINDGEYAVVKNSCDGGWWCGFAWSPQRVNEHTGDGGGALLVNATGNTSQITAAFYRRELTGLCENSVYEFSAYYVSLGVNDQTKASLTFEIFAGGTLTGGGTRIDFTNTGEIPNVSGGQLPVWRYTSIPFSTVGYPVGTTFYVQIRNNQAGGMGNDLMIDDIVVTKCMPTLYLYEEGTTHTSISVCSSDPVRTSVELTTSVINVISSGTGTVYAQLMKSTNQTTWTAVGPTQTLSGTTLTFSIIPPATGTDYYMVKLSNDPVRAANPNLSPPSDCRNDVITLTFDITRDGSMANAADPIATPLTYICNGAYVASYTLTGNTPSDATEWGWSLNDPTGASVTYSSNPTAKIITVNQSGNWYFFYKNGDCRGWKMIPVTIHTAINIPAITITQPGMVPALVCNGSPLNLTPPTIPAGIPVDERGWLLNGVPFTSGTVVTMADNGKTLTYFAKNDCDRKESNGVIIRVGQTYNTPISDQHCFGVPYTANGFNIPVSNMVLGVNTYTDNTHRTVDGCDSIVTLTLTVVASMVNANIETPLIVCGNDEDIFNLLVSPTGNPADMFPTNYKLVFEPNNAGFGEITGTFSGGNIIEIPIPANIYPDNYKFTLELNNASSECGGITYSDTLKIYYSNKIMQQKWDDVIALLNYYYNGGYEFAGYQWYKNNKIMTGKTYSYIYIAPEKLNPDDCYQVLIKRDDGSQIFSCCFYSGDPRPTVNDVPVVISNGGNVTIYFATPRKATANIYSVTGILIGSANLDSDIISMPAPPQGTYLLEILSQDNNTGRQVFPFVVNRR